MIEDFFHLPPVSKTSVVHLELRISPPEKLETALIVYSGAWGELIHEKNRSQKSRDTVPLMIVDPSGMFIFARWPGLSMDSPRMAVDDLALVKGASLRLCFCYFVILGSRAYKVHYSRLVTAHMNDFYLSR
jgi:hypothetical protein